jgi:hypothetical protein
MRSPFVLMLPLMLRSPDFAEDCGVVLAGAVVRSFAL